MGRHDEVERAIGRWLGKGIVSEGLAERLREEVAEASEAERRSWAQYAVGITGALILVIAAFVFGERAWRELEAAGRVVALLAGGVVAVLAGRHLERARGLRPVGYVVQSAGLVLLLVAFGYSEAAWSGRSFGTVVMALGALATPLVSLALGSRDNPVMPAVNAALGYAFLFLFLDRIGLHRDMIPWVLDGVLLITLLWMAARLRSPRASDEWLMPALLASLFAGLVLVFITAEGPLNAGDDAVYGLDVWLGLIVAVVLWAIHRAPPPLRRGWYGALLAWCVVLGTVFAFWTFAQPVGAGTELTALGVGGWGGLWVAYGLHTDRRNVLLAGCGAVVAAALFFGFDRGRALGAVAALVVSAAFLFWVAARMGRDDAPAGA